MGCRVTEKPVVTLTRAGINRSVRMLWESGRMDYQAAGPDEMLMQQLLSVALSLSGYRVQIEKSAEPR